MGSLPRHRLAGVAPVGLGGLWRRAVRLRCPTCGTGTVYERGFVMRRSCDGCGLEYEVRQGFFVGAIYVNYAVTAVLGLGSTLNFFVSGRLRRVGSVR